MEAFMIGSNDSEVRWFAQLKNALIICFFVYSPSADSSKNFSKYFLHLFLMASIPQGHPRMIASIAQPSEVIAGSSTS